MNLQINGEQMELDCHIRTMDDLLRFLKLEHRIVIVEQNGKIVPKEQYTKPLNDGDKIEIVHFVGGG